MKLEEQQSTTAVLHLTKEALKLDTAKKRRSLADKVDLLAMSLEPSARADVKIGPLRIQATFSGLKVVAKCLRKQIKGVEKARYNHAPDPIGRLAGYMTKQEAIETIRRHLDIQGHYMEETQVAAAREYIRLLGGR